MTSKGARKLKTNNVSTLSHALDLTLLFQHITYALHNISAMESAVTENDLIEFNFRSGQSKKQFQRASLPGLKFVGERIKKKEAIENAWRVSLWG